MRPYMYFLVGTLALTQMACSALLVAAPYAMTLAAEAEREAARKRAEQQAEKMRRDAEAREREEAERQRQIAVQESIYIASAIASANMQSAIFDSKTIYLQEKSARREAFVSVELALEGSAARANLAQYDDVPGETSEQSSQQEEILTQQEEEPTTKHISEYHEDVDYNTVSYSGSSSVKSCVKGCRCGNTCISCSKKCRIGSPKTKKTKAYKPKKTKSYSAPSKRYKSSYSSGYKSSYRKSSGRRGGRRRR